MARIIDYRRGDIYYIEAGGVCVGSEQKPGRPGVIVSNDLGNKHSSNVEVVFLTSQSKKELPTHVSVICKVPSTALCENIQTVSKERLGTFIRACSDDEMREIDNALLCSLGITIPEVERELEESYNFPPSTEQISVAEIERNLYKSLYEQLLDKMVVTRP